jgi:hypothetical protein
MRDRRYYSLQKKEIFFTFMGPCIVNVFKHNQQDATLHNGIYYYTCSACFRRFVHPWSGAQKCIHGIGYLSRFFCFLLLLWMSCSNSPTIARQIPDAVYSFELLMMGRGTAWNMQSIYSNKHHCIKLHLVGYAWINNRRKKVVWKL